MADQNNIDEVLRREESLRSLIERQGDEPPTSLGRSLLEGIFKTVNLPFSAGATVALRNIDSPDGIPTHGFDPSKDSIWDSFKTAWDRNYGLNDVIEAKAPEIDFLSAFGISPEKQASDIIVKKNLPEVNFDAGSVRDRLSQLADSQTQQESNKSILERALNPDVSQGTKLLSDAFGLLPDKVGTENLPEKTSLRGIEEGTEKGVRVVSSLLGEAWADPWKLLSYGGVGFKGATALQKGDDAGQVIKNAAGKFLTPLGSDTYAAVRNESTMRELMGLVPDAGSKKQIYQSARTAAGMSDNTALKFKSPQKISEEAFNILERTNNPLGIDTLTNDNLDSVRKAIISGDRAADDFIKGARAVAENRDQVALMRQAAMEATWDPKMVVAKEQAIAEKIGAGQDFDVKDLFQNETLRFGGYEVPGFMDMKEYLNGKYYNASQSISQGISKARYATEDIPILGKITAGLDELRKVPPQMLSANSRRVMTGGGKLLTSDRNLRNLKEFEASKVALDINSFQKADELYKGFTPEEMDLAYRSFEEGKKRQRLMKIKNPGLPLPDLDEQVFRDLMNSPLPAGKGAAAILKNRSQSLKAMARKEKELGILDDEIQGYLNREYNLIPGKKDTRAALSRIEADDIGGTDFTGQRQFPLVGDAIDRGAQPIEDLKYLTAQRMAAHEMAVANRKFMQNMMFQNSLSADSRDMLAREMKKSLAGNVQNAASIKARTRAMANELGMQTTEPDLVRALGPVPEALTNYQTANKVLPPGVDHVWQKVNPVWGLPRNLSGEEISIEGYDILARRAQEYAAEGAGLGEAALVDATGKSGLSGFEDFQRIVEKNQLKFTPEERQLYSELWDNYKDSTEKLKFFGRQGELITDRAGLTRLPESLKKRLKGEGISKDTAQFYDGELPAPLIDAINDSLETKTYLQKFLSTMPEGKQKDALSAITKGYATAMDMQRFASTQPWGGYHVGNLIGGTIQATGANGDFFKNINPFSLVRARKILDGKADLITDVGERVSHNQLLRELKDLGVESSIKEVNEMTSAWADLFESTGGYLGKDIKNRLADKTKFGSAKGFGEAIENFSRGPTYLSLRAKGYSPDSAKYATTKALIDYRNGKTQFEKSVNSNLLFFYAFARGNASNTVVNMLTNPHAISANATYIRAVSNALREEGKTPPPDFTGDYSSIISSQESLPIWIGEDDQGGQKMISRFRTPLEGGASLLPLRAPGSYTPSGLMNAVGENAKNVMESAASMMDPMARGAMTLSTRQHPFFKTSIDDPGLRQVPKLEAIQSILSGEGPIEDPTRFSNSETLQVLRNMIPAVEQSIAKTNQFVKSDNLAQGLGKFFSGINTQKADLERSAPYHKLKLVEDFIRQQYGVDVGNRNPYDLEKMIEWSQEGKNPKKQIREEKQLLEDLRKASPSTYKSLKKQLDKEKEMADMELDPQGYLERRKRKK